MQEISKNHNPPPTWELHFVEVFGQIAKLIGIPKSVGEVYGLLFATDKPMCMHQIGKTLSLSKAGVSKALGYLKRFQAVNPNFVIGERKEYFVANRDFAQISEKILSELLVRDLTDFQNKISLGKIMLSASSSLSKTDQNKATDKLNELESWLNITHSVIPVLEKHIRSEFNEKIKNA